MSQEHSIDTKALLTCFFAACEDAFRFLEREHGYIYCAGLATYAGGRQVIRPFLNETIAPPFFAVTRYEKGDSSIEITYGDRDSSIGLHFCPDRIHRFTAEELLHAAGKRQKFKPSVHLNDVFELERAVQMFADILEGHESTLIDIKESVIRKAAITRARDMEKKIRSQFRKSLKDSVRQAARAFTENNPQRVIALLKPYEHYLKRRDLKKLESARQTLIS